MPLTPVNQIDAARLRQELLSKGFESYGSRNELVCRLGQAGITEIDTNMLPSIPSEKIVRFANNSSVLLGNGAMSQHEKSNQFIVQNNPNKNPLINGDFENDILNLSSAIHIRNTNDLNPSIDGKEGDIRRKDGKLYMFRQTGCYKGWYELQFGSILLV